MRILLIGNYPPDRQESMLRFAALMERELSARGHQVTLIQPAPVVARVGPGTTGVGKWLGYVDKFMLFPASLKQALRDHDVVHICDHSNSMYIKHLHGAAHVVTCHDVLAIASARGEVRENSVSATGKKLQQMILAGLKAAQFVVCVSSVSRSEMLRVTGRPESSSSVVLSSLPFPYSPMPAEEASHRLGRLGFDASSPFFLHVGSSAWYKNRIGLLQIFDRLHKKPGYTSARLMMIGDPVSGPSARYIRRKGLENRIVQLADVSNEDLRAAYSLAQALIFPSLQEGFGWPILEAQACGCPVFATNREPMTEVGGSAAVYIDPADPEGAAGVIAQAMPDRGRICAAGLENLERFNVEQMIDGYIAAYRLVIEARGEKASGHAAS